jgi:hypothetical protein
VKERREDGEGDGISGWEEDKERRKRRERVKERREEGEGEREEGGE